MAQAEAPAPAATPTSAFRRRQAAPTSCPPLPYMHRGRRKSSGGLRPSTVVERPPRASTASHRQAAERRNGSSAAQDRQVVQQTEKFDQQRGNIILPRPAQRTINSASRTSRHCRKETPPARQDAAAIAGRDAGLGGSAAIFMCATSTATFNTASTASCCPTASARSADPRHRPSSAPWTLLTGALPAQYGFRTSGVIDIQTKSGAALPAAASASMAAAIGRSRRASNMAGSRGRPTISSPAASQHRLGLENPMPDSQGHSRPLRTGKGLRLYVDRARSNQRPVTISGFGATRYRFPTIPASWQRGRLLRRSVRPREPVPQPGCSPNPNAPPIRPSA